MIENDTSYDFLLIYIFSGIITLTVMIGNLFALIFTSAGILHLVSQGQNMLSAAVSIEASEWLSTAAYKTSYCCCICFKLANRLWCFGFAVPPLLQSHPFIAPWTAIYGKKLLKHQWVCIKPLVMTMLKYSQRCMMRESIVENFSRSLLKCLNSNTCADELHSFKDFYTCNPWILK